MCSELTPATHAAGDEGRYLGVLVRNPGKLNRPFGLGQSFVARMETVCEEKKMIGALIAGWAADGQTASAGHSTAPQDVLAKTWEWI
jgi:hypothetical protein